jgi:hypothetical protein
LNFSSNKTVPCPKLKNDSESTSKNKILFDNRWDRDEKWKTYKANLYLPEGVDTAKIIKKYKIKYFNENVERYQPKEEETTSENPSTPSETSNNLQNTYINLVINLYILSLCFLTLFSPKYYKNAVFTAGINFIFSYVRMHGVKNFSILHFSS